MRRITVFFLFYILVVNTASAFVQKAVIDSLLALLQTDQPDSNKVNHLGSVSSIYFDKGDYENVMKYASFQLELAQQLNFKKGIILSYNSLGDVYNVFGNSAKSFEYYSKALKISEELNDKNQMANCLIWMWRFYNNRKQPAMALNCFFKSLKIYEELKNEKGIGMNINNIAVAYTQEREYDKALHIGEQMKKNYGIVCCLYGIGTLYYSKEDYPKALDYYFKALKISKKGGFKDNTVGILRDIGNLYICTKRYVDAEKFLLEAYKLNKENGNLVRQESIEEHLTELYTKTNRSKLALEHYRKAVELKDTIIAGENQQRQLREKMNEDFDKKEMSIVAENEKQNAIEKEKNYQQTFVLWLGVLGLLVVIIFIAFVFRSIGITRKQKQLIEIQNTETEHQKEIIEEKNKDITSSIRYAKRIQNALLREEEHISTHLPEHFILFMPKDIVSGDFYWGAEKQDYWYFAAADCTGHGVPGAIMSMLGISFLNDIVYSDNALTPSEILNKLRDRMVSELRQTGEDGGSKDGMDISLVRLNLKTNEINWAGANNELNIFRNGKLEEIKADKQPIGYYPESHPFTNHTIQLQKGDTIYIYSDGFADQFGGDKGKKLNYKRLNNLIVSNQSLPMKDQKELLKKLFLDWKGLLEQVDDVCVFGVRI
jgi:serine phosphatase RsbU (regulator of sigma subunit)